MIRNFVLVAAGAGLGAMLRYGTSLLFQQNSFPVATFLINIVGSFAIGVIMALSLKAAGGINEDWRLFLASGVCGGFTTFSAFSYENLMLFKSGKQNIALIYTLASVACGITAAWFGFKLFNY